MTRTYAMQRLLEHGALTFAELLEITGWPKHGLEETLRRMARRRQVARFFTPGCHRFVYRLPVHDPRAQARHLEPRSAAGDGGRGLRRMGRTVVRAERALAVQGHARAAEGMDRGEHAGGGC